LKLSALAGKFWNFALEAPNLSREAMRFIVEPFWLIVQAIGLVRQAIFLSREARSLILDPACLSGPSYSSATGAFRDFGACPNNSFKPNPLRGFKTPHGFLGGSA
jgi:hypothetical protein